MRTETYNAIMIHRDQFIAHSDNTFGTYITLFYNDKETIKAIVDIARGAGHKVTKRIIGKGTIDAEVKLFIN